MRLHYKYIHQAIYLFFGIACVLSSTLNAQDLQKYDVDLHKIDSIVSTGSAFDALEMSNKVYLEYRLADTTSNKFKKLCTNYLFVLENLDLNEKAISLSHEVISFELGKVVNAQVYLTLSLVHEKARNKELAKEYLDLSKPLVFGSLNDSLKAIWLIRSSSYNRMLANLDSARIFAIKAYQLSKKIGNKSTLATSALLNAALTQNDSLKLEFTQESLKMFLEVKDYRLGTSLCVDLYRYYMGQHNKEKAMTYLIQAQEIGKKTSLIDSKADLFYSMKNNYAAEGDFAQAYKYADSLTMILQLIYTRTDHIKLLSTDFKFKTGRLKHELNKAEQIVERKEEEKQQLIFSITGTFVIVLLLLFIAYDQRKKKRIATLNKQIIETQNTKLIQANEENKLLMHEMNHRLKNNLSTLSAILEIQSNQESEPKIKEALQKSLERVDLLASLHKLILNLDPQKVYASNEIITEVIKSQLFLFNTLEKNVTIEISPIKLSTKDINALVLIVNELLTNALKYGKKTDAPVIHISLIKEGNTTSFYIINNGSEMPKEFEISNRNSSGLYITNLLVHQLGGELQWQSASNSTKFFFSY